MTIQAPNWYRELIRDRVRVRYQSMGGYLDGTMTAGDGSGSPIKFPRVGRVEAYELLGSIQNVPDTSPDLDMIDVATRDFEASAWMRIQDFRKQGPSEQDAVAKMLAGAIRRKRDDLRMEALHLFAEGSGEVETIGDGTAVLDVLDFFEGKDAILGSGAEEDLWFPIPHTSFSQLNMYDEFANADYTGPTDLPLAKSSKVMKRTWQGVHVMGVPDEVFKTGTAAWGTGSNGGFDYVGGGYIDTYMWATDAMGYESNWDQETMSISRHPEKEGTPTLGKTGLNAAAVGILPEGVKRIRIKVQKRPVRV